MCRPVGKPQAGEVSFEPRVCIPPAAKLSVNALEPETTALSSVGGADVVCNLSRLTNSLYAPPLTRTLAPVRFRLR